MRPSPSTGSGASKRSRVFTDLLAPACISVDHPRFLSFVPAAPTDSAILFDLVVGASSIYGGSWMEGAGAVFAENQALRWIADLVGLPDGAGGVFVSGGTAGNLSALVAARLRWREAAGAARRSDSRHRARVRRSALVGEGAAHVMDVEALLVPADDRGRMTGRRCGLRSRR